MRTSQLTRRESIWEYPRTPIVEPVARHIRIVHRGTCIADTLRAVRTCENGHPPTYYIPPEDVRMELLEPSQHRSFCEWKGVATFFDLVVDDDYVPNSAWTYPDPTREFEALRDFVAFFAHCIDHAYVDGEEVRPEPRASFGGWITSDLEGPFR